MAMKFHKLCIGVKTSFLQCTVGQGFIAI